MIETFDPLPHRYITSQEGVGGIIKEVPEDFVVDEIPLGEPTDEGEHLYLRVRTKQLAHGDAVALLARHFGVSPRRIGYAGMKDKQAVTSQAFTVHTPREYREVTIDRRLDVLWWTRTARKLRRGQLAGNRFSIRIRQVDPLKAPAVAAVLEKLEQVGVPNYFGHQRFGFRCNNHLVGALLLKRHWQGLLDELLGVHGSPFPEHQREARESYQRGDYKGALRGYGRGARAERQILQALDAGHSPKRAALSPGRRALSFWVNATQSAVFNHLLDERIDLGLFDALEPGDLAWKHDSRAVFAIDENDAPDDEIARRLKELEISPSGPLWGSGMIRASGAVDEREVAGLAAIGLETGDFDDLPCRLPGGRRPFRVPITNTQTESGVDDRGPYIRVVFDLPRGAYATVALREIMKRDDLESPPDGARHHARGASRSP